MFNTIFQDFYDFSDFKSQGFEAALFITTDDFKLHIIDFKIEVYLLKHQCIDIILYGKLSSIVTAYNTLKNATIILRDNLINKNVKVTSDNWNKYFCYDSNFNIIIYDERFSFLNIVAEWMRPFVLCNSLISQNDYIIETKVFQHTPSNVENDFKIEIQRKYYIFKSKPIYSFIIKGNLYKGFVFILHNYFNIELSFNSINDLLSFNYPDITCEKGISDVYWDILNIFNIY